jgi:hypothetical protein
MEKKMKKSIFKVVSLLLLFTFLTGQMSTSFAFDNLAASLASDGDLNKDRAKKVKTDVGRKTEPGAIGNGQPLIDLIQGNLPKRISQQDIVKKPVAMEAINNLREAIDLAIRLYIQNRDKIPAKHTKRAEETLANLITLQQDPVELLHLYMGIVTSSEDYLLGYNYQERVGLSLELVNMLNQISPIRLAQYIFHESVPEKHAVGREDHRKIYSEIQTAIFGKKEVAELGKNLRNFITLATEDREMLEGFRISLGLITPDADSPEFRFSPEWAEAQLQAALHLLSEKRELAAASGRRGYDKIKQTLKTFITQIKSRNITQAAEKLGKFDTTNAMDAMQETEQYAPMDMSPWDPEEMNIFARTIGEAKHMLGSYIDTRKFFAGFISGEYSPVKLGVASIAEHKATIFKSEPEKLISTVGLEPSTKMDAVLGLFGHKRVEGYEYEMLFVNRGALALIELNRKTKEAKCILIDRTQRELLKGTLKASKDRIGFKTYSILPTTKLVRCQPNVVKDVLDSISLVMETKKKVDKAPTISVASKADEVNEDELKYRAELFKANLIRILTQNPDETYVLAIDADIGEKQKAQIMPIYNAIDQLKALTDEKSGRPLLPNLRVIRGSGSKGELMKGLSTLLKSKKVTVKADNIFLVARQANVVQHVFDSLKGKAWIASIYDERTEQYAYLPVFEAATLTIMAAIEADVNSIMRFYNTIAQEPPVLPKELQKMIREKFIYIFPKIKAMNPEELRELYELAKSIYLSA